MRPCIIILLAFMAFTGKVIAQTTNQPSCYSNAAGWSIDKIEQTYDGTYVHLKFYSYEANYSFYFDAGMYIVNHNDPSGAKYYVQSFVNNQLSQNYSLQPYTEYEFILQFQRIPSAWTDIDLEEPAPRDNSYTPWHWEYVSLNRPTTERLKLDNFLLGDGINFLKQSVHPLTTMRYYRYSVDHNSIRVALYYEGGYVTDLKIDFYSDFVYNISVEYDNDFIDPFTGLELIRDIILDEDKDHKASSRLEQYLRKQINDMSGRELASVALTVLWANFTN
jgi:hypothetical protein